MERKLRASLFAKLARTFRSAKATKPSADAGDASAGADVVSSQPHEGAIPAAKPDNDRERVDELRQLCILDTARDPRFDRITSLAAELLGVPIVLVSLVDDSREWFKSKAGTEIEEIPRDLGFCAHALLLNGAEVLTVTDTLTDDRFATHPYVSGGPQLRFYAGAPLITNHGYKIGMLCVHDVRPRPDFGESQTRILSQLAGIVMDEINFNRVETERALLIGELAHRVKNVLALVQSIASISGRGNPDAAPFVAAFSARLAALAASHDHLVVNDWTKANLRDVVTSVVAAHQNVDQSSIVVDVPQLMVSPSFAQSFALIVHELLTNSIKYGALTVATGRIAFTAQRGNPNVEFVWRETGGPRPVIPTRLGFGHRMLDVVVRQKGSTVELDWQPTGLICRFNFAEHAMAAL